MGRRQAGGLVLFLAAGCLVLVVAMVGTAHATGANVQNRWLVPAGMLAALLGGALLTATPEIAAFWVAVGGDEDGVRRRTGMSWEDILRVVGWFWLGMGIVVLLLGIAVPSGTALGSDATHAGPSPAGAVPRPR